MDLKIHLTFIPTSDGQWSIAKLPEDTPSELKEALNPELYCAFLPLRSGSSGANSSRQCRRNYFA